MTNPTPAERTRAHYDRQVKRIATMLRNIADEVEAEGRPRTERVEPYADKPHLAAVARIQHELTWGVANLPHSALIDAAVEADDYKDVTS
jgi:hypothetical protein